MRQQGSFRGEVFIDHRASPGLPEHIARLVGYDPERVKEGKLFEAATLSCAHCRVRVIPNPARTRERGMCLKCANHYICDVCAFEAQQPDYVHKPYEAKVFEAVGTDKWQSVPSPRPSLTQQESPKVLLQLPANMPESEQTALAPPKLSTS